MTASSVLTVDRLCVNYGGLRAIDDVSFTLGRGAVVGLMGPNGAGKTTVLNALVGLVRPSSGRARLGDTDITRMRPHRRTRAGVAVASQHPRPFADLTVREHLELTARQCGKRRDTPEIDDVLMRCTLTDLQGMRPLELSPSHLRRLELARALAGAPSVLLLDEVGAGLPSEAITDMVATVRDAADRGQAVLVVDHVMELLLAVAQRLIVLDLGRVVADGAPEAVMEDDAVSAAYFGTELPI